MQNVFGGEKKKRKIGNLKRDYDNTIYWVPTSGWVPYVIYLI